MTGSVQAWHAIDVDTTPGVDVLQLETAMNAAGFDAEGWLEVDDTVDENTILAIQAWQTSLEMDPTGEIGLGEVVFEPGEVTVVALNATVGSVVSPGEAIVDLRRGMPYVDVSTDASWATVGENVAVSVDQTQLTGQVVSLESGIARVELATAGNLRDGSSARVTLTKAKVAEALLVPSSSIIVSDIDGPTVMVERPRRLPMRIVRVKVLASANSKAADKPVDDQSVEPVGDQSVEPVGDQSDDSQSSPLTEGTEIRMY